MKTVKFSVLLGALLISLQTDALLAQSFALLHTFGTNADGQFPIGGLTASGGILYGTTDQGDNGSGDYSGTIYSICTNGSNYTLLYSFNGSDGQNPTTLPVVSNGWIYGTTYGGGSNLDGIVYRVCTNGSNFTALHTFDDGTNGKRPAGSLLLTNGWLYGTTGYSGQTNSGGTLYSLCTNGNSFGVLHTFDAGEVPCGGRLAISAAMLYGMTSSGGSNNYGIIYCVSTNGGNFTALHNFTAAEGGPALGNLVLVGNTLYGCSQQGSNLIGAVFAVGTDGGNFRPLHSFTGGSDGGAPQCTLVASSNTLYGVTQPNGSSNGGTVFAINTDGSGYNVLYDFTVTNSSPTNANGIAPTGTLLVCGSQIFGITAYGGSTGLGTVFGLTLPPPQVGPPFFTGYAPLADNWNYLGTVGGDQYAFGYYSSLYFPYIYHLNLGWEYYIDADNANHGAYFYDFASGVFFYTEPAIFPYWYDFNQNAWMFCAPQNGANDQYQSNPRWFRNMSTGIWTTNL